MEGKKEKSISFDKSVSTLSSESSEASLKKMENKSVVNDKLHLESDKFTGRIKLCSSKRECSKSCKYKETDSKGIQVSNCKSQMLLESSSRQRKFETKFLGEMSLSDRLKTKMKRTSKKFQSALPFLEKTTKHTLGKVKSLYKGSKPRRALGFKCDLKKCNSSLMECSTRSCKKDSMIFGERARPYDPRMTDSSASDISTMSSASGRTPIF